MKGRRSRSLKDSKESFTSDSDFDRLSLTSSIFEKNLNIQDDGLRALLVRKRTYNPDLKHQYEELDYCLAQLKSGIIATKYHYSRKKYE